MGNVIRQCQTCGDKCQTPDGKGVRVMHCRFCGERTWWAITSEGNLAAHKALTDLLGGE